MPEARLNAPKRIFMGLIDAGCARIMITTPETIDGLHAQDLSAAETDARQRSDGELVRVCQTPNRLTALKLDGKLPSSRLYSAKDNGEDRCAGVIFSSNASGGRWPIYAELAPDPHELGYMQFKSVSVWFGFGGDIEKLMASILQIAGLAKGSKDEDDDTINAIEDLAYSYGVELDQFTDPAVAVKALELACGAPLVEALKVTHI